MSRFKLGLAAGLAAIGVGLTLGTAKPADARVFVSVGLGLPIVAPVYAAPAYYGPAPVWYGPGYYAPRPVWYGPGYYAPGYIHGPAWHPYWHGYGYGWHGGWHRHW